ncbi:hypothetical protein ACFCV3_34765 [Kribbella sp. NPDC056345]|uniref:hypothetical protein n=1 Tax=Kribbella sp. NPDC056345 TaxID=3345789 RepID=UPI0035DF8FD5
MPTYSDDGQWWWDGRSWQPVSQQPSTAPQQQPYAAPQQYAGQPQYAGPPQQPKKKGPALLIVAGAVVLVLIIAVGGVLVWKNTSSDGGSDTAAGAPPAGAKIIEPGQPVTAQALSEVHPQAFHESVIKRQMTAPIGQLRTSQFQTPADFASRKSMSITDVAIDHKLDKFSYQQSIMSSPPTEIRCVNGKEIYWSDYEKKWTPWRYERPTCSRKPFIGTGDAIVSSGLSAEQADKAIAYLRGATGFVNPAQPTLLSVGGRSYVRQVVDFKPVTRADGNSYGSAIPMWAFRETGNDPATWTWGNPFNLASGIHMVYYLDTATLLPVAAFQSAIPSPKAYQEQTVQLINYAYPAALPQPKLGNGPNTMALNLPEGWKVP